jgi:phage head maturation protease
VCCPNTGLTGQIGSKPLGPIRELREDRTGAYYEVDLLDTSYNRDLRPGLAANLYGASFRMRVQADEWDDEPGRSDANPDGLPERTITRDKVLEFGPVTFPANPEATANVRSLTDQYYSRLASRGTDRLAAAASSTAPMTPAERSARYRLRKRRRRQPTRPRVCKTVVPVA